MKRIPRLRSKISVMMLAVLLCMSMLPLTAQAAQVDVVYDFVPILNELPSDADFSACEMVIRVSEAVEARGMAVVRGRPAQFCAWIEYEGEQYIAPMSWSLSGGSGSTKITPYPYEYSSQVHYGSVFVDPNEPAGQLTVSVSLNRATEVAAAVTVDVIDGVVIYDGVYYDNFNEAVEDAYIAGISSGGSSQVITLLRDISSAIPFCIFVDSYGLLFELNGFNLTMSWAYDPDNAIYDGSDGAVRVNTGSFGSIGDGHLELINHGPFPIEVFEGSITASSITGGLLNDGSDTVITGDLSGGGYYNEPIVLNSLSGSVAVGGNVNGNLSASAGSVTVNGNVHGAVFAENVDVRIGGDVIPGQDEWCAVLPSLGADITIDGSIITGDGMDYIYFWESDRIVGPDDYDSIENGYRVYTDGNAVVRVGNHGAEPAPVLSSITLAGPVKTVYTQGEALDLAGLAVTAHFANGSSRDVTGYTTSPADRTELAAVGTQTVSVCYSEGGVTKTASFDVTVSEPVHEHQHDAVVTSPTCTEQGYTTYTCDCGDSYIDEHVAALGHDWGAWTVTTPASCDSDGEESRVCANDPEEVETRPIAATGHIEDEGVVTTPPTATEDGVMTYYCSECGTSLRTEPIPALAPVLEEITIATLPNKLVYIEGEPLDLAGIFVMGVYSDGTEQAITDYTASPEKGATLTLADNTVSISYTEGETTTTASFSITVNPASQPVAVDGVTLDETETTLDVGGTKQLSAMVTPEDAENKAVQWRSSEETVATVDENGFVTALAPGSTIITATTDDGGFEAFCAVTVNELEPEPQVMLTGITLRKTPNVLSYIVGDKLNLFGMTVVAQYSDGTSKTVSGYAVSPSGGTVLGTSGKQTITVRYEEDGIAKETTFTVNVAAKANSTIGSVVQVIVTTVKNIFSWLGNLFK